MKIIISESQLEKILQEDAKSVVNEQQAPNNDEGTLIILQNRIDDLLRKKEKELLNKNTIKLIGGEKDLKLQIGDKTYQMNMISQGNYSIIIPPNRTLSFGVIPMKNILPDIEKIPEYTKLIEKYPSLKQQIERGRIKAVIYTDQQNEGSFKFYVGSRPDRKDSHTAVPFGTDYPLGEFFIRNKILYKLDKKMYGYLESGGLLMDLSGIPLSLNFQRNTVLKMEPVTIKMIEFYDLFAYNRTEFKDKNIANQQLSQFIKDMKDLITKYGDPFIAHLKIQNPTILGYSSIDGDPDQKINGGLTRKEYDLQLSEARAKIIANIINKSLPELGGMIQYKGLGETNQFGPGWTKEAPTKPKDTAPNRRYVLSPIQPFIAKY